MKADLILLIAKQFWKSTFKNPAVYVLLLLMVLLVSFAGFSGWKSYVTQNSIRQHYQEEVREHWESNPDKHPHRMAHYGSFAFRLKHKLSMFDFGIESFTGNAVFLEAHKQNTVNFSEASFSTGLLRFGEISLSMLLQIIFPLIIFFLGYSAVAGERETGTLKVILCQGVHWMELFIGKLFGLMGIIILFYLPVIVVTSLLLFSANDTSFTFDDLLRFITIIGSYLFYLLIISSITILVSASSKTSKESLVKLLGIWLVFMVLLPKTSQAIGNYLYPAPSKAEFDAAIEADLIRNGDSHNPDDVHYKALKDSLLKAHGVDSVEKLPFNYGGFIMKEGERISATIYQQHLNDLLKIYQKQIFISDLTAFVNPYQTIKSLSMALSCTDFNSYVNFQDQAEQYRYQLAQQMNELQIQLISNKKPDPDGKSHIISSTYWKSLPEFNYRFITLSSTLVNEALSIVALVVLGFVSFILLSIFSKKAKAV